MKHKERIYSFIMATFERDLNRYCELSDDDFETFCHDREEPNIGDFFRVQKEVINRLSRDELRYYSRLIDSIENEMFQTMDKESMVIWPVSGFFFSVSGKLVFFHER